MRRWSMQRLESWKRNPRRKPLLLLGARQVGKTWLMQEFGRLHYKSVVYIRFDKDEYMRNAFEQDYEVPRLLEALHVRSKVRLIPGETLIIFDEIQECPSALTSLKYFCEEAREHHIVAAGSLLGLSEHTGTGFPVGKVDRIYMYPMSFPEFLDATGNEVYVELLRKRDWQMLSTFRAKIEEQLRLYYYVGGMPEAVSTYVETRDVVAVREVQLSLLDDYRKDFSKHATPEEAHLISLIWKSIPAQLAREDKRFVHSDVERGMRAGRLRGPIRWLEDAGLIQIVRRVSQPEIPMQAYTDSAFKMYFLDVGLLGAKCELDADVLLEGNNMFKQYKGALTEQYVQQQLRAELEVCPYYWSAEKAQAEVDFLMSHVRRVVPIEVKAEKNLQAKSLRSFCKRFECSLALRVSMAGYEQSEVRIQPGSFNPDGYVYSVLDVPLYAICTVLDEVADFYSRLKYEV